MRNWALSFLAVIVAVGIFALLWPREAGTDAERAALDEGRAIVVYWDRHFGHEHDARCVLIDEFNRSQNKVYVRAVPIGYNASMEKLLTAIAGGSPPDICGIDNTIMGQLVAQGCFTPLEDRMAKNPYLQKECFLDYCWNGVAIDGHVWGVPTTTDTYCLLWNKNLFRRAGLDPERPPQTLDELQKFAAKLTIQDKHGIQQVGFLPWQPWDMSPMWGLFFGGQWYDDKTRLVTCANDPGILKMFYWQRSFARDPKAARHPEYAIDPERIQSFQKGFGAYMSASNPFYSGKIAMIAEGEWQATFIPKYAPDLDWGVAPLPMPEGQEPMAYGGAAVTDCIPRGCKNPDAAWAFFEWFYSPRSDGRPSPASDYNYAIHNIPCRPAEARQERFMNDPRFRVFVEVLTTRKVVTSPVMPIVQFMNDEIERQRERVVFYRSTPEEAAQAIEDKVNDEIRAQRHLDGGARP